VLGMRLSAPRLRRPTAAYAPWFNVVLKCARLAVSVLQMLSEEARPHLTRSPNDLSKMPCILSVMRMQEGRLLAYLGQALTRLGSHAGDLGMWAALSQSLLGLA
jgi:hypothetical protein